MKLLTNEIQNNFKKYPLGSQDGKGLDAKVIVKFFNPYGVGTWLITECEKDGDDYLMYGYCELGAGYEWGYVSFNELNNVRVNVFGMKMPLERDKWATGTVRDNL